MSDAAGALEVSLLAGDPDRSTLSTPPRLRPAARSAERAGNPRRSTAATTTRPACSTPTATRSRPSTGARPPRRGSARPRDAPGSRHEPANASGSSSGRLWPRAGSSTYSAFGRRAASARPFSTGTIRSASPWTTSAGAVDPLDLGALGVVAVAGVRVGGDRVEAGRVLEPGGDDLLACARGLLSSSRARRRSASVARTNSSYGRDSAALKPSRTSSGRGRGQGLPAPVPASTSERTSSGRASASVSAT